VDWNRRGRIGLAFFLGGAVLIASSFLTTHLILTSGVENRNPKSDTFLLGPALSRFQQAQVAEAIQVLEKKCMSKRGDGYVMAHNPILDFVQYGDSSDPLFIDASRLRRFGYGTSVGDFLNPDGAFLAMPADRGVSPEQNLVNSLTPSERNQYSVAYGGSIPVKVRLQDGKTFFTIPGGCEGISFGKVYGATKIDWGILHYTKVYTLAQDVIVGVINEVEAGASYKSAMTNWSTCMSARGFKFSNRNVAFASLVRDYQAHPNRLRLNEQREKVIARADASCSVNAKLNAVSEKQVSLNIEAIPEVQIDALKQWRLMQLLAIRNALTISARKLK
jgi:hypothetical protein